jgi:hypothetical protein
LESGTHTPGYDYATYPLVLKTSKNRFLVELTTVLKNTYRKSKPVGENVQFFTHSFMKNCPFFLFLGFWNNWNWWFF